MSGSKIHTVPFNAPRDEGPDASVLRGDHGRIDAPDHVQGPSVVPPARGNTIIDVSGRTGNDELTLPGLRQVAPSSGLHSACAVCGAPSVRAIAPGCQTYCESCRSEQAYKGAKQAPVRRVAWAVPVTSTREVALSNDHIGILGWTGTIMLGASVFLFFLLFSAWNGIDFSLARKLSPWLVVYLPIPLGVLNGFWSLQCSRRKHILHEGSGACASRAGMCGTAWGCSGPACALNLGLDLGVLITALLAALPAGASASVCGYECFELLCFPCAPDGGQGIAAAMAVATLIVALGAAAKMWVMTSALRGHGFEGDDFLPW